MSARPRQGEVWWADAPEPVGRRPVLILTRDAILDRLTNVSIAPLTTTNRKISSEVPVGPSDGLPRPCIVSLDNIQTFPKRVLDTRITKLDHRRMLEVWEALRFAFDMPD